MSDLGLKFKSDCILKVDNENGQKIWKDSSFGQKLSKQALYTITLFGIFRLKIIINQIQNRAKSWFVGFTVYSRE